MRKIIIRITIFCFILIMPGFCRAMPPGTLLYRTSGGGKMYGYSSDPLISSEKGIINNIYSGHVAIYIGRENGEDYIVEAANDGIVKTPAKYFVNTAEGEIFLGAKIPSRVTALQQAKAVLLAKSLVGKKLGYDVDFHKQKGPNSGEWTCVGLTEKIYESANIPNPNNLGALEYDPNYYAIDITPDGFDNYSKVNSTGDCFSRDREFSKIAARRDLLVPAPELLGFDVGLEKDGERYIFMPYTQFLQPTLETVKADIEISSSFSGIAVRGAVNTKALVLRWSLINNPLSSLRNITSAVADLTAQATAKIKTIAGDLNKKIFGSGSGTEIVLDQADTKKNNSAATSSARKVAVNKAKTGSTSKASTSKAKTETVKKASTAKKTEAPKKTETTKKNDTVKKTATATKAVAKTTSAKTPAKTTTKTATKATAKTTEPTAKTDKVAAASTKVTTYYNPVTVNKSAQSATDSTANTNKPAVNQPSACSDKQSIWAIISKIYNTANNYWIELYNPTDCDLDLAAAGYRLEKTRTADDPALIARIGNNLDGSYPGGTVIKAHGNYLIASAEADSYYKNKAQALITRDEFNWGSSGYTLYLGSGPISSSGDSDIVDAVGFGSDATYFQGNDPAAEIKFNYFLKRVATTNNNSRDFSLFLSDHPSAVTSSSSTSTTTPSPETGNASSTATSSEPVKSSKLAVINKIYATGDNDWIELFNTEDYDFDLAAAGYRLEKTKSSEDPSLMMRIGDTEDGIYPQGTIIKAHDKYLIVRSQANSYYKNQADAIATRDDFGWTGTDYTIYLGNGAISSSTDKNILDVVGFGSNATYFRGSGPASEIPDNYYLNRLGFNNDNRLDFNLLLSDDPSISTSSSSTINTSLFIPPTPIVSENIVGLWHFDECYGTGNWGIGKWECSRNLGYDNEKFSEKLNSAISLNNFSLSFYYKESSELYSRLAINLKKSDGDNLRLAIEPSMLTVDGLPNSASRYYKPVPFDSSWHRATLVVDQSADYWAVYIDGREIVKENFWADLPTVSSLEISGDCGPYLLDELAVWNRSLSPEEIMTDYVIDAPYSPTLNREPQQPPSLFHFWDFTEDSGLVAADSVGSSPLSVASNSWTGRSHDNYAINTDMQQEYAANLAEPLASQDISLTFWWHNGSYPTVGRANIFLQDNKNTNLFSLLANSDRLGYWFNGSYGYLTPAQGSYLPNDNDWHHLALVYDSYRFKLSLYVDGEEKATTSMIWWPDDKQITKLKVGTDSYGAAIDELGLWEGALTAGQIKEIYTNTK